MELRRLGNSGFRSRTCTGRLTRIDVRLAQILSRRGIAKVHVQ